MYGEMYQIPEPTYHRIATFISAPAPAWHHFPPSCIAPSHDTGMGQIRTSSHSLNSARGEVKANKSLITLIEVSIKGSVSIYQFVSDPENVIARGALPRPGHTGQLVAPGAPLSPARDREKKLAPKLTQDRTRATTSPRPPLSDPQCHLAEETRTEETRMTALGRA